MDFVKEFSFGAIGSSSFFFFMSWLYQQIDLYCLVCFYFFIVSFISIIFIAYNAPNENINIQTFSVYFLKVVSFIGQILLMRENHFAIAILISVMISPLFYPIILLTKFFKFAFVILYLFILIVLFQYMLYNDFHYYLLFFFFSFLFLFALKYYRNVCNFPMKYALFNKRTERKFLTVEQYDKNSFIFTKNELDNLRKFCNTTNLVENYRLNDAPR